MEWRRCFERFNLYIEACVWLSFAHVRVHLSLEANALKFDHQCPGKILFNVINWRISIWIEKYNRRIGMKYLPKTMKICVIINSYTVITHCKRPSSSFSFCCFFIIVDLFFSFFMLHCIKQIERDWLIERDENNISVVCFRD